MTLNRRARNILNYRSLQALREKFGEIVVSEIQTSRLCCTVGVSNRVRVLLSFLPTVSVFRRSSNLVLAIEIQQ